MQAKPLFHWILNSLPNPMRPERPGALPKVRREQGRQLELEARSLVPFVSSAKIRSHLHGRPWETVGPSAPSQRASPVGTTDVTPTVAGGECLLSPDDTQATLLVSSGDGWTTLSSKDNYYLCL